jgi:hypothetical protein
MTHVFLNVYSVGHLVRVINIPRSHWIVSLHHANKTKCHSSCHCDSVSNSEAEVKSAKLTMHTLNVRVKCQAFS